ncbi:MAG: hypothetical protein H7Y86_03365 [Rhizobacter sp.]|nr:hypothetical protein [Ferruginibacter sp.]
MKTNLPVSHFSRTKRQGLRQLKNNTVSKKENAVAPTILPETLQRSMACFLEAHGAKSVNIHLRKALIGYVNSTEHGTPHDFNRTLRDFEDLMEFLDLAEKEYPTT